MKILFFSVFFFKFILPGLLVAWYKNCFNSIQSQHLITIFIVLHLCERVIDFSIENEYAKPIISITTINFIPMSVLS